MVAFVGGASFSGAGGTPLSGWFPLGAGEPFYPSYFCTPRYFTQVNLTNMRDGLSSRRAIDASNYYRYYHTQVGFRSIRYVNRKAGTIAVPSNELASGHRTMPDTAVHPTVQQWASARVLSHPMVAPTLQSLLPHLVATVAVPTERPPVIVALKPAITVQPSSVLGGSSQGQSDGKFRLIARTPPAVAGPAFERQLPALSQDPGRPLDPIQVNNLAHGRPAGSANTREFPPSTSSSPRAAVRRTGGKK
jgi:hypothetical protein